MSTAMDIAMRLLKDDEMPSPDFAIPDTFEAEEHALCFDCKGSGLDSGPESFRGDECTMCGGKGTLAGVEETMPGYLHANRMGSAGKSDYFTTGESMNLAWRMLKRMTPEQWELQNRHGTDVDHINANRFIPNIGEEPNENARAGNMRNVSQKHKDMYRNMTVDEANEHSRNMAAINQEKQRLQEEQTTDEPDIAEIQNEDPYTSIWEELSEAQKLTGEPMDIVMRLLKHATSPEAKHHKSQYDSQYESTPEREKYHVDLNRERRKRGIYGHGGPDMSHTKDHTLVAEDPHTNRARHFKERGTLKSVIVR